VTETDPDPLDDDEVDGDAAATTDSVALDDADVAAALEAILLVVDAPASDEALAAAVGRSVAEVREHLQAIAERLTSTHSGIDLRESGGGWRFYTRDVFAPVVERFVMDGTQTRLSKAALETLAVVAYRQPVTRARISAVRGVNVDGVVRTLLARGMIEEEGADADTGGTLYRTTEMFLERMGLASLEDLPSLGPLLPDVDQIDDE
jgi:segregation and condensation protein B